MNLRPKYKLYPTLLDKFTQYLRVDEQVESFWNIDAETGETLLVDTTSKKVRMDYEKYYRENVNYFKDIFSKCGAGTISSRVDESYVTKLLGYFKARN